MTSSHAQKKSLQLRRRLAVNVRRLRKKAGLAQQGLADKAGIHRTHISLVECAACNPSLLLLTRLALTFRVRIADLLR